MTGVSPRGLICQKRLYGLGLLEGGELIIFTYPQVYKRQYLVSFFYMKYFDLNANQDGIKEEKSGQLFSLTANTYEQANGWVF